MKFEINKIKPSMTHEEKVYEYARRISFYSLLASEKRAESKIFECVLIPVNKELTGESCGCTEREAHLFSVGSPSQGQVPKCEACEKSSASYKEFRDAVSKKAAALRQLNKEMSNNK